MAPLYAFVFLISNSSYIPGALTAVKSLLEAEGPEPSNQFETVVLCTPANLEVQDIKALRKNFSLVVGVEEIRSGSKEQLQLLGRQDLASTLTKLHLFRLIQFKKVIFLDADTLVLQPLSHLFSSPEPFSAAPDSGWPDCFNSGMFVATPSVKTFDGLVEMSKERGSWDGGDQGLLNDYFPNWHRLSFIYNVTPTAYYQYAPAYRRHGSGIKLVHFIGSHKPWHEAGPSRSVPSSSEWQGASDYASLVNRWFGVYNRYFSPRPGHQAPTFSFPNLQAVWDIPGGKAAYVPPSLEDLKRTFQGIHGGGEGSTQKSNLQLQIAASQLEGHYVSMPLRQGQPDLSQPLVFEPPKAASPPTITVSSERTPSPSPPQSAQAQSPPRQTSPPPQQAASSAPRAWSPQLVNWNPAQSAPPKDDRPQMAQGFDRQYDNIWDGPRSANQRQFFDAPARYGAIPSVTYQDYNAVTAHSPDWEKIKPVFPWESRSEQRPARVFPSEPIRPGRASSSSSGAASPKSAPQQMPAATRVWNTTPAASSPTGQGLSSAYANAWDSIPGIKRYANNLSGKAERPPHSRAGSYAKDQPQQMLRPSHSRSSSAVSQSSRGKAVPAGQGHGHSVSVDSGRAANGQNRASGEYEEAGEASSRDGDDEDEDEEDETDEDDTARSRTQRNQGSASSASSTSSSGSAGRPPASPRPSYTSQRIAGGLSVPPRPERKLSNPDVASSLPARLSPMQAKPPLPGAAVQRMPSRTSSSETITPTSANSLGLSSDPSEGSYKPDRVSRVFDPSTAPEVIRQEGIRALRKFVERMEDKGSAANGGQPQRRVSPPGVPSVPSPLPGSPTRRDSNGNVHRRY